MKDNGPVSSFLAGVEEELESSADDSQGLATWGPVLRPDEAPERAGPPPTSLNRPVWSRSYGWNDIGDYRNPMLYQSP